MQPATATEPSLADSTSSWFLPPTPPPTTVTHNRPALMNWLSHKSHTLRGRSGSFNRDQPPLPPPAQQQSPLRISEPIPIRDDTLFHTRQRPSTTGSAFSGALDGRSPPQPTFERLCALKTELPPIPASPRTPVTLRSSKSSPALNSPTSPNTAMFNRVHAHVREGVVLTSASAPITPRMTPVAQAPLPLPPISTAVSSRAQTLSISTTSSVPPMPAFEPVLVSPQALSSIPPTMDPKQFLVTLETATSTQRTTLATLVSRPSSLADYLNGLRDKDAYDDDEADAASASSSVPPSPFTRAFSAHLTSQGLHESQASSSRIHIFLDRPSAPYSHILAYLRSPTNSPASLPRSAQLRGHLGSQSNSPTNSPAMSADNAKLDALYELRDEATYLGLRELSELCEAELKRYYSLRIGGRPESEIPLSPISARLQGRRSTEHMRKMSRGGPNHQHQIAVPESVHETEDGEDSLEAVTVQAPSHAPETSAITPVAASWRDEVTGSRTSLSISEGSGSEGGNGGDVSTCTVKAVEQPAYVPHQARSSAPMPPTGTVVGLATRSRSNSRAGHGRTGSVVVPPSMIASSGRTSFLPNLGSPITPHSVYSSANWI